MAVLRNATCKQDREWNHSRRIESYENHMWAGFRYYADKSGQKDHQDGIVAYPSADVDMLEHQSHDEQDTEGPCEDRRQMLLYDMVPDVFFHEMVRCEDEDKKEDEAQSCEKHVHPVFAQKIDL